MLSRISPRYVLFALIAVLGTVSIASASPQLRWPLHGTAGDRDAATLLQDRPALSDHYAVIPPTVAQAPVPVPPVGEGEAALGAMTNAELKNAEIAISFVDGTVMQPGERFSFDDMAQTWDYHENPIYLFGPATSIGGLLQMRGSGVCWVSTALWRAALDAGLRTDFRQEHYGMVQALGAGLDATNTLAIRNDSTAPITVHAELDADAIRVSLTADQPLDRTATMRGPASLGRGQWVVYQDVQWEDGSTTTTPFYSHYYW